MKRSDFYFEDVLQARVFRVSRYVFFFLVFLVGFQLVRVGIFQHDLLGDRASANIHNFRLLPAPRGEIVDRTGALLAGTEIQYGAYLLPRELPEDSVEREAALLWVSSFFDVEMEFLLEEIERRERYFDNRILISFQKYQIMTTGNKLYYIKSLE